MTVITDPIIVALRLRVQTERLQHVRATVSPSSSLYYAITAALVAMEAARIFILGGSAFDAGRVDEAINDLVEALPHA